MTFEQITKDLKAAKYHPVYFLQGEEPYFIDCISDFIEENVLDEAEKTFDQMVVYGRDVNKEAVVGLAKGFPMIAKRRVIIVKEAQSISNLTTASKSKKANTQDDLLEKYLENPTPSTILVFCYKYKTLDKRTTLFKLFEKSGVVFESKKLQDYKVAAWISDYVKNHDYNIGQASATLLSEYLGNDLSKISNEVQKLFIGLPKGSAINNDVIEQHIGISKDYNVFELQNAIGRRDLLKINRIINYYEANPKENPVQMVIPILFKYFAKILIYHRLKDKSQAASALGVNPYFLNDYVNAARNYPQGKIIENIHVLREYDMRSKGYGATGNLSNGDLYKELIFRIIA
ncbi:MAG: DNA polymerase III subunit delta [Bacteroidales bacterium]|nr:DNA polymerase III subunit delta [Bacteroidales bacterium]